MPPKMKTPAPIDRPLSKAYLRGFTGWSTAYPPGSSDPTSLRFMENVTVDRNGALRVRAGMRYLSYTTSPDIDPLNTNVPGLAIDRPMVGSQEPFYTINGDKALLFGVRETDGTVGFRAILFTGSTIVVRNLTDPLIGFSFPQGEAAVRFSPATTHIEYLQIDNRIIAMSDAGEDIRIFFVGAEKIAKRINSVTIPRWEDSHQLIVKHPEQVWITKQSTSIRRNEVYNPSFEIGMDYWILGGLTSAHVQGPGAVAGGVYAVLQSVPTRTNLQTSPLHDVSTHGTAGWHSHPDWGKPKLTGGPSDVYMTIYDDKGSGTFLAYGAKLSHGVRAGQAYVVAVTVDPGTHVQPIAVLTFYNASGAKIGKSTSLEMPRSKGRYVSPPVTAPADTVTMRVSLGGRNEAKTSTFVKVRDVLLCKAGEPTDTLYGGMAEYCVWTGAANASASVYHPPTDISLTCSKVPIKSAAAFISSIYLRTVGVGKNYTLRATSYDKHGVQVSPYSAGGSTAADTWVRTSAGTATSPAQAVLADMLLTVSQVARGELVLVDAAMIESEVSVAGVYFDGTNAPGSVTSYEWGDRNNPHRTFSVETTTVQVPAFPAGATPTAKTLIATPGAGTVAAANPYKIGFFYTFENEVGESAASKVTEVRTSRPWSNWVWESPNAASEPSGTYQPNADLTADQLVCTIPQAVYNQAIQEGAIRWNLYAFAWSDQEPVPVVAALVGSRHLYPDVATTMRAPAISYDKGGWLSVTPARRIGLNDAVLPTRLNRVNYSESPNSRTGLVAGDRIILLGDPSSLATIRWSSNRPGEYTNFTASRGGGSKTLTTGNLHIPGCIVLWQNPQSVDTLAILCMGSDGPSISYYMMPATVNAQSSTTGIMGFEETTSTPGTTSPYGAEVMNNALFRPLDRALMKSTAQNYNINHKTLTDLIVGHWRGLRNKEWIMSAQLDNRLYYLVHNPLGELLEKGCKGNEIWCYDAAGDKGVWSRFLIQACTLRVFNVGPTEHLGITRPEGLYYLDLDARLDDYVDTDPLSPNYRKVYQRPIPWMFETNTQGANRAHDAWAHLQQVQVTLGNFHGTAEFGIRGHDVNHKDVQFVKRVEDLRPVTDDRQPWDIDDVLLVRRDLKEWYLFGRSVEGLESSGILSYVQYRYTPVSVNVGYEYGSIETFEYGTNVASGPNQYSDNGIPVPVIDFSRP